MPTLKGIVVVFAIWGSFAQAATESAQSLCLSVSGRSWDIQDVSSLSLQIMRCYKGEVLDGPVEHRHPNGIIALTGQYETGLRQGLWIRYSPNGKMIDRGKWKDDLPVDDWEFFDLKTGALLEKRAMKVHLRTDFQTKSWFNHLRLFSHSWIYPNGAFGSVGVSWQPQWRFLFLGISGLLSRSAITGTFFPAFQVAVGASQNWGNILTTQLSAGAEIWQSNGSVLPTAQLSLAKTLRLGPFDQWFAGYGLALGPETSWIHEVRLGTEFGW